MASIKVSEDTLARMEKAKALRGARNYDEPIRRLLDAAAPGKKGLGAHPDMKPFEHEETSERDERTPDR